MSTLNWVRHQGQGCHKLGGNFIAGRLKQLIFFNVVSTAILIREQLSIASYTQ